MTLTILTAIIFGLCNLVHDKIIFHDYFSKYPYWSRARFYDNKTSWFDNLFPMFADGGHLCIFISRVVPVIPICYYSTWWIGLIWGCIAWGLFFIGWEGSKKR